MSESDPEGDFTLIERVSGWAAAHPRAVKALLYLVFGIVAVLLAVLSMLLNESPHQTIPILPH